MKSVRRRDTAPEVAIRTILHRMGLRYRVDCRPLPNLRRRADLLFPREMVAVYIDGCFWHGCPLHASWPKENADFWRHKISANRIRDESTNQLLSDAGWLVIRVWEHEDSEAAAKRIAALVIKSRAKPRFARG